MAFWRPSGKGQCRGGRCESEATGYVSDVTLTAQVHTCQAAQKTCMRQVCGNSALEEMASAVLVEEVPVELEAAIVGMNARAARQAAAQARLAERKPPHQVAESWQREVHPTARMALPRKAGLRPWLRVSVSGG